MSWLDPAEQSFGALDTASASERLKDRSLRAPLAYVERGAYLWAFVDTDGDGKLDAALATDDKQGGGATTAFAVDEKGKKLSERPELLGTLLGAPVLPHSDERVRERLSLIERVARLPWRVSGKGLAGLPHPVFDVGSDVVVETSPTGGYPVLSVEGLGSGRASSLLFDLRADPKRPLKAAELERRGRAGDFPAVFAWVARGTQQWFFYDLDQKPGFDFVVFSFAGETHGLRLEGGRWKEDAASLGKKPIRPVLFKDAKTQAALKAVARGYFLPALVEE